MAILDCLAGQGAQFDALFAHLPPFPADGLALAAGQRFEKSIEALVAPVVPMELLARAFDPAGGAEGGPFVLRREGHVHGRDPHAVGHGLQRADQGRANGRGVEIGPHQQARSGHRREGDRRLQLRVITAASPLEGIGPAPVEHILAVRVAF